MDAPAGTSSKEVGVESADPPVFMAAPEARKASKRTTVGLLLKALLRSGDRSEWYKGGGKADKSEG